jgi:hypothetical protein
MKPSLLKPVRLGPLGQQPLVSVLMPVYNYAAYLPQALESLVEQTYEHFEVIVCDDGSTDESLALARRYSTRDPRIRVIPKHNGGQASALNAAYEASCGEILCILDPDDFYGPRKIARVVRQLQDRPDAGVIVHSMVLVDRDGNPSEAIPFLGRFEEGWIAEKLIRRGGRWRFMPSSALSFRREAGARCMPIPETHFRGNAEAFLFTLLPLFTPVSYIAEPLSCYRVHGSNMTGDFVINLKTLRYWDHCMRLPNITVNQRLSEMGLETQLDLSRNLDVAIVAFKLSMLEGRGLRDLWARYAAVVRLLLYDDIYRPLDKLLVIVTHGIAMGLSVPRRQWLFNQFASPSPMKKRIQRIMRRCAGMLGSIGSDDIASA